MSALATSSHRPCDLIVFEITTYGNLHFSKYPVTAVVIQRYPENTLIENNKTALNRREN